MVLRVICSVLYHIIVPDRGPILPANRWDSTRIGVILITVLLLLRRS